MSDRYVVDTCSLIRYFGWVFDERRDICGRARGILDEALSSTPRRTKVSFPSVVFVEIYDKWCRDEESKARIYCEVHAPVAASPNIEIRPIDIEILEMLAKVGGNLKHHEINDKIIVASAMVLSCPIVTTDPEIITFARRCELIPAVISG